MSRVAPVPGGATDDDDSRADNPRSGKFATMAPNQETTSDRIETVVYPTMLGSTTSACRTTTIDETTTTVNVKGLRTTSTRDGLSFTPRTPTSSPTTATTRTGGGPRSSNLLKRKKIRHRGPHTETDQPVRPTTADVSWVRPCCLQRTGVVRDLPVYPPRTTTARQGLGRRFEPTESRVRGRHAPCYQHRVPYTLGRDR